MNKAKYEANTRYLKKAYDQLVLLVRKDSVLNRDAIQRYAESKGMSVNAFVARAVAEAIERDRLREGC